MRTSAAFMVLALAALGAACATSNATRGCPTGRTELDGVCVSDNVADFVSCVRAQGAQLYGAKANRLAADAKYAGAGVSAVSEASDKLEKKYASATDANALEIIRACRAIHGGGAASASTPQLCGVTPMQDAPAKVCSPTSATESAVTFTSRCADRPVELAWIGFDCREVTYGRLEPGRSQVMKSFAGHVWRIRDAATHQLLREVTVAGGSLSVDVP